MSKLSLFLFMISIIFLISCSDPKTVITHNGNFETYTLNKNLISDVTFDGNVSIMSSIAIEKGVTVTFTPGTVIRCDEAVVLEIRGTIYAQGNETDSIYFISSDENSTWGGFSFQNDSDEKTSLFEYCKVTGAHITFSGNTDIKNSSIGGL